MAIRCRILAVVPGLPLSRGLKQRLIQFTQHLRHVVGSGLVVGLALLLACDASPPAPVQMPPGPSPARVDIQPVVQLHPDQVTHLTVSPRGIVYVLQAGGSWGGIVFSIGAGELLSATPLSTERIMALLEPDAAPDEVTGAIQSIVCGADGELYFYFAGGRGRKMIHVLGQFDPRTEQIRILSDTPALAAASGMKHALTLTQGRLLQAGPHVLLWLRHSDDSIVLGFQPRQMPAVGKVPLRRMLTRLRDSDDSLDLTRLHLWLYPGDTRSLLVLDRHLGRLWKTDLDGDAHLVQSLAGLPDQLSWPAVVGEDLAIVVTAGDPMGPGFTPPAPPINTAYPALLLMGSADLRAIGPERFFAPGDFPLETLRITTLVTDAAPRRLLGYDAQTGQLLRLTVHPPSP